MRVLAPEAAGPAKPGLEPRGIAPGNGGSQQGPSFLVDVVDRQRPADPLRIGSLEGDDSNGAPLAVEDRPSTVASVDRSPDLDEQAAEQRGETADDAFVNRELD